MSIVRLLGILSFASLGCAGCADTLSNKVVVRNSNAEEADPVVTVCVVDCEDDAPIPDATLSTGPYSTMPDHVLGKTDGMGRWHGVLRCTYIWPDHGASDDGSASAITFTFTLSSSTNWLWITRDGYIPQRIDVSKLRSSNVSDKLMIVRATRGQVLRGRVTRAVAETPVRNEPILLIADGPDYPRQFETVTDNSGRFEWSGFPGGEVAIVFGVAGMGSEPFFERHTPQDGEIVVSVSSNWQSRKPVGERHLLYVAYKDGIALVPAALEWLKLHGAPCSMFSLPNELGAHDNTPPVRDLVLSIPEEGHTFYFLALLGEHGNARSCGEWNILEDDALEDFQGVMNDPRSEHPMGPN